MRSPHRHQWTQSASLLFTLALFAVHPFAPAHADDQPGRFSHGAAPTAPEVSIEYVGGGLWNYFQSLDVSGNHAYVGTSYGVEIYDVSDPSAPTIVSRVHTEAGEVRDVHVHDDLLLFVASNRLHVVDIHDLHSPVLQGTCQLGYWIGYAASIAALGHAAYVADWKNGLEVVDLSDPSNPVLVQSLIAETRPRDVEVDGNTLLVTSMDGLRVYSASAPLSPHLLGHSPFEVDEFNDVAGHSGYAFVSLTYFGVRSFDYSQPTLPNEVGQFDENYSPIRNHLVGNTLYVAEGFGGLSIHDLSNPLAPVDLGRLLLEDYSSHVGLAGTTAIVINSSLGVQLVDVSNPSAPAAGVQIHGASGGFDVVVQGDYAFVEHHGLKVVSLSNPALPRLAATLAPIAWGRAVAVQDDLAFAPELGIYGHEGVRIFSVEDPEHPVPLGFYPVYGNPEALWIEGDLLYIASGNLRIADVSNPMNPMSAYDEMLPGEAMDVWVELPYAYVANGNAGLSVIDVSDPYHPSTVGSFDSPGFGRGVTVQNGRAYLADGPAGLQILDVSNPQAPVVLGSLDTPGNARRVRIWGDYALVSDETGGLRVVNVANPSSPYLYTAAAFDTRSLVQDVEVVGDQLVVVADGELLVLSIESYLGGYLLGDTNADASVTSSDVIYLVNFVFKGGPQPQNSYRAGDLDCNGPVNSADLIRLVNYVFKGAATPYCP